MLETAYGKIYYMDKPFCAYVVNQLVDVNVNRKKEICYGVWVKKLSENVFMYEDYRDKFVVRDSNGHILYEIYNGRTINISPRGFAFLRSRFEKINKKLKKDR